MILLNDDEILDKFGETLNENILNRDQRLKEVAKAQLAKADQQGRQMEDKRLLTDGEITDYDTIDGRWWLFKNGKAIRPLTDEEEIGVVWSIEKHSEPIMLEPKIREQFVEDITRHMGGGE